jgi:hypothetical protein
MRVNHSCRRVGNRLGDLRSWKVHAESRALGDLGLDFHHPAGLRCNPVDGGHAEARALAWFLGGEERLEQASFDFRGHAGPRVDDLENYVRSRPRVGVRLRIALIEFDIGSLDRQLTACRHRISCIDREIHDDLLDLATIGFDFRQLGLENERDCDIRTDQAAEHSLKVAHDTIQVEQFRFDDLLATKGKELARKVCSPDTCLLNLREFFMRGVTRRRPS